MSQLSLTGIELRDAGVSSVTEHTPGEWRSAADQAIVALANKREPFTADDVRELVGDPPNHPNAMGARFLDAVRAGIIRQVGRSLPVRASRHASSVGLWIGVSPEQLELALPGAESWLDRVWGAFTDDDGMPWAWDDGEAVRHELGGPVCCPRCARA
jgi:hypothetical protein